MIERGEDIYKPERNGLFTESMTEDSSAEVRRRGSLAVLGTVLFVGVVFITIYPAFGLRWYLPVYDRFASLLPIVFFAPIPVAVGYAYVLTRTRRGDRSLAPSHVASVVAVMLVSAPLFLVLDTTTTVTLSYAIYGLGVGLLGILAVVVLYD